MFIKIILYYCISTIVQNRKKIRLSIDKPTNLWYTKSRINSRKDKYGQAYCCCLRQQSR